MLYCLESNSDMILMSISALSSAAERIPYTDYVAGSIPAVRTMIDHRDITPLFLGEFMGARRRFKSPCCNRKYSAGLVHFFCNKCGKSIWLNLKIRKEKNK